MTLAIELDLDMVQVDLHVHVKFLVHTSNGSVVRVLTDGHTHTHTHTRTDRQTDRQTDGTDSIISTTDAGGKKA